MVDFCDKPIMVHQIAALAKAGVKEVILAINYEPYKIEEYLPNYEEEYGVKITCSKEEEPMGTGGPIRLAKDLITAENEEGIFFVLNSDVICDFPFTEMIEFHKSHGGEGTILTTKVEDPSRFGVILSEDTGKIKNFIEKPIEFVGDMINAGIYLFSTSMIDRIKNRPTSIEKEIFPIMAKEGQLYTFELKGFWKDIDQPLDFLKGVTLYLNHLDSNNDKRLNKGNNILGNVMIAKTYTLVGLLQGYMLEPITCILYACIPYACTPRHISKNSAANLFYK